MKIRSYFTFALNKNEKWKIMIPPISDEAEMKVVQSYTATGNVNCKVF